MSPCSSSAGVQPHSAQAPHAARGAATDTTAAPATGEPRTHVPAEHPSARADPLATTLARVVARRSAPARALIQRSRQSAKHLKRLAEPQIGPGPAVDVQKQLVDRLEGQERIGSPLFTEINLGAILITDMPADDRQLINRSTLIDLQALGPGQVSAGVPRFPEVEAAGAKQLVVENTLKTMIAAGQVEYLRKSGLPNHDWSVLVEVQYVRSRPKDATGFHKDTRGQTLFVNLNYHIPARVIGPESVVNPSPSPEHDAAVRATLPKAFRDDLDVTRSQLPDPTKIGARVVEPYGFVAFVDEAIHHATPLAGHRFVRGSELKTLLIRRDPATLADAQAAYDALRDERDGERRFCQRFATQKTGRKWWMWMAMIRDSEADTKYTRPDFERTMTSAEVDLLLEEVGAFAPREQGGAGGFHSASVPNPGAPTVLVAVKPGGSPPLKRTVSQPNFTLPAPLPEDTPRRFFRTWVRVIPKRFVRASELKQLLKNKDEHKLEQARVVYAKFRNDVDGEARFRASLAERGFYGKSTGAWWMWMKMIEPSATDRKYTRGDFERAMAPAEVDLLLDEVATMSPRRPLEEFS